MADFTTTAAVKAFAGVQGSGDDAAIGGLVTAVSAVLAELVGHDYSAAAIVGEIIRQPPTPFAITARPISSVSAVREAGVLLAASGYRAVAGTRILERRGSAAYAVNWGGEVSVDYTPTSTVPADLELAAREATAWVIKESGLVAGASRLGLTAQANPDSGNADYYVRKVQDLPIVRAVLATRRRMV